MFQYESDAKGMSLPLVHRIRTNENGEGGRSIPIPTYRNPLCVIYSKPSRED